MDVIFLSRVTKEIKTCFYAPTQEDVKNIDNILYESSSDFKSYSQLETKHQLFVCTETGEIVFFIPARTFQNDHFKNQQRMMNRLKISIGVKANNVNKGFFF